MGSIVLTVHNQQEILPRVLEGIYSNTSKHITEMFVIIDGCTDFSDVEVIGYPYKTIDTKIIYTDDVYETKANNVGLKHCTTDYAIIVQDDCVITQTDWDKDLLKPIMLFNNVFAVSGRCAHNINKYVDYYDFADREHGATNDKFYTRMVVNRGPLLLKMDVVRQLNYFDEIFYPQNQDDHDLCLRAYREGWICGSRPIEFISDRRWGGTRKGNGKWIQQAIDKNMKIIQERHYDLISKDYPNEERQVSFFPY